jgi:hypothetical protein
VDASAFSSAEWISKQSSTDPPLLQRLLVQLDEGEAQAITIAVETSADWLIIDELIRLSKDLLERILKTAGE